MKSIFALALLLASMHLLYQAGGWKLMLGVFLFGWFINLDNRIRETNHWWD